MQKPDEYPSIEEYISTRDCSLIITRVVGGFSAAVKWEHGVYFAEGPTIAVALSRLEDGMVNTGWGALRIGIT